MAVVAGVLVFIVVCVHVYARYHCLLVLVYGCLCGCGRVHMWLYAYAAA